MANYGHEKEDSGRGLLLLAIALALLAALGVAATDGGLFPW